MSSKTTFDQIRDLQTLQKQIKKHEICVSSGDLSVTITGESRITALTLGKKPNPAGLKKLINRAISKAQKYNLSLLQGITQ